jgi:hypothetical protein
MSTTSRQLADSIRAELTAFAWNEWSQLGVFTDEGRPSPWTADLEALILVSLRIGREDPRLFDAVLDWMVVNEHVISVRRLRRMAVQDTQRRLIDAALAAVGQTRPQQRFTAKGGHDASSPEPLFPNVAAHGRDRDPAFASFGFARPPFHPRGQASRPDLTKPIAFALRMRELLGVGVRAEAMTFLLTVDAPTATAQAITESAFFAKRNVQEALASLTRAGAAEAWDVGGQHRYQVNHSDWAKLLNIEGRFPEHRDWPQLLGSLDRMLEWLDDPKTETLSPYLLASASQDMLDDMGRDLMHAGILVDRGRVGEEAWDDFVLSAHGAIDRLV